MPRSSVADRLWSRVDKSDGCWLWTGATSPKGYGYIGDGPKLRLVHRLAYELEIGPIPEGLVIDHVAERGCTHRNCVNPAHLEAVTSQENQRRGTPRNQNHDKTHCKHGHAFDEANTHHYNGSRRCRACARDRTRRYRAA